MGVHLKFSVPPHQTLRYSLKKVWKKFKVIKHIFRATLPPKYDSEP